MRDLEADLKLCEAATEGPWDAIYYDHTVTKHPNWEVDCNLPDVLTIADMGGGYGRNGESEANARFIAAARTGWPETIQELMEARKRIEELEAEIIRKDVVITSLADRVAAQSELLSKLAEKTIEEREACARIAEQFGDVYNIGNCIAGDIRSRGSFSRR